MENIGISEVLNRINDTVDIRTSAVKTFGINFYTADGDIRKLNVRKYTRGSLQHKKGDDVRAKAAHNLQRNGLIMLNDVTNSRTIQVRATSIFGFCDYQSDKWLKVYH